MKKLLPLWMILNLFPFVAFSQIEEQPDVRRGFYTGVSTGSIYFLDESDRRLFKEAWLVGIKAGYDIWKYLAVEAQFKFSGHNTSRAGTANQGIPHSFLTYQGIGLIKVLYPITRRLSVFADVGGGFWHTDPNQKTVIGSATRGMFTGGLGIQYFLRIRGLALGLDPSLSSIRDMNGLVLQTTGYIRYTF